MQKGSLIRSSRRQGPDVWEYRWRESCSGQRRKHRRIVIGTLDTLKDESAALKSIAALRIDININDRRLRTKPLRLAELVAHYRQKELANDNEWKTLSTRVTYEGYLRKWIVPRWGSTNLSAIRAIEVELWLRTLPLARASRTKIRNLMSVLFNHARRHEFTDHNPITLVRQSAKRRTVPVVLLPSEINLLVPSLRDRERTLVLLAAGTGLRMSEGETSTSLESRLASCDLLSNRQSARAKQKHPKSRFHSIHVWFGLFVLGVALPVSVNRRTGFSPVQSARGSFPSGDRPFCDITSGRLPRRWASPNELAGIPFDIRIPRC